MLRGSGALRGARAAPLGDIPGAPLAILPQEQGEGPRASPPSAFPSHQQHPELPKPPLPARRSVDHTAALRGPSVSTVSDGSGTCQRTHIPTGDLHMRLCSISRGTPAEQAISRGAARALATLATLATSCLAIGLR